MTFTGPQIRPAISRAIVLVMGTLFVTGMALVGCAAIASAGAPTGDQQVIEFKGGGTDPVGSPVDQMMQRFVKALAERGVRALDDRTVEFRLVAPAPYFMSVMNRPDAGPQPRHAIDAVGDGWIETGSQVVSGAFRIAERESDSLVLERRTDGAGSRRGNG